jgi:serine protease Do
MALLAATPAGAQGFDPLTLIGPGSAIGVRVRDLNNDDAKKAKLEASATGVVIEDVIEDSPADRAGFKQGDVVTEFDGERVRSVRSFTRLVSETPPRRTVQATIIRDGSRRTLEVTPENSERLAQRQARPSIAPPLRILPGPPETFRVPRFGPEAPAQRRLGVTLESVDGQMADVLGVSSGAMISAVDRDSAAARSGLKAGDVVTAINDRRVRLAVDVSNAVRDAAPRATLKFTVVRDKKELTLNVTLDTVSVVPLRKR